MESYLLKSAVCLAIFYWFYKLLLENENMHTFKRYYLLVMLIFSFLIPLISFSTNVVSTKTISPIVFTNLNIEDSNNVFLLEILPLLLGTIYLIGVVFFSFRFGKNLFSLIVKIKKNVIASGANILDLVLKTKLANSKGEIRRMIKNNGLRINNEVVTDEKKIIDQSNFDENNNIKISHGKKQHVIVKII